MKMEKTKALRKRLWLKIIAVIAGLWVLLMGVDFVRFAVAETRIKPLILTAQGGCHCYESRIEYGLGYSFHYSFDSDTSYTANKPDSKSFCLFGLEIYSLYT